MHFIKTVSNTCRIPTRPIQANVFHVGQWAFTLVCIECLLFYLYWTLDITQVCTVNVYIAISVLDTVHSPRVVQ